MKKYTLTGSMLLNGIEYKQIKAVIDVSKYIPKGTYGGWVNSPWCLSHEGKCWIEEGAIVTDTIIYGDAKIYKGAVVDNSIVGGSVVIDKDCVIYNCKLHNTDNINAYVINNTTIKDKTIDFLGRLDDKITNTNYWHVYSKFGINIYCGYSYCKAGCLTASYRRMWETLHKENSVIEDLYKKHPKTTEKFIKPEVIEWLKTICALELKRLNIKVEDDL